MKLRYKFAIAAFVPVIGATTARALTISYDAPCESAALAEPREPAMRAVIYRCYGSPEVLMRAPDDAGVDRLADHGEPP